MAQKRGKRYRNEKAATKAVKGLEIVNPKWIGIDWDTLVEEASKLKPKPSVTSPKSAAASKPKPGVASPKSAA